MGLGNACWLELHWQSTSGADPAWLEPGSLSPPLLPVLKGPQSWRMPVGHLLQNILLCRLTGHPGARRVGDLGGSPVTPQGREGCRRGQGQGYRKGLWQEHCHGVGAEREEAEIRGSEICAPHLVLLFLLGPCPAAERSWLPLPGRIRPLRQEFKSSVSIPRI